MKTIFLDFDGVLFDTVKEAYLLSRYAFSDISPFEKINNEEYDLFYNNKYLITDSWQYFYLMKVLKFDKIEYSFKDLISHRDSADKVFDYKFQKCRLNLMQNYFDFWSDLDTPYPFLYEIRNLLKKLNVLIISTKNHKAISDKLKQYSFILPDDKIIGKEILTQYESKGEFISNYINEMNINNSIFIDDSIENLDSCRPINNIQLLLANWGYCNPNYSGQNCQEIINKIKEEM